jgi:hypothetical protein
MPTGLEAYSQFISEIEIAEGSATTPGHVVPGKKNRASAIVASVILPYIGVLLVGAADRTQSRVSEILNTVTFSLWFLLVEQEPLFSTMGATTAPPKKS